jgi:hypothetical protein
MAGTLLWEGGVDETVAGVKGWFSNRIDQIFFNVDDSNFQIVYGAWQATFNVCRGNKGGKA